MFSLTIERSSSRATSLVPSPSPEPDDSNEQSELARWPTAPVPVIEDPPLSAIESWANDADLDALVHHFLDEVPSMESVRMSVQPRFSGPFKRKSAQSSRRREPGIEPKGAALAVS